MLLNVKEKVTKLPFLGEKRVRLLGTGAESHPHFASCPVDTSLLGYTALQNWHPGEFGARRSTTKPTTTPMIIEHTAHDTTSNYAPPPPPLLRAPCFRSLLLKISSTRRQ